MTSNTSNRSIFALLPLRMVGMDLKCFDVIILLRRSSIRDLKPNLKRGKLTADLRRLHGKLITGSRQPRNNMSLETRFSDAIYFRSAGGCDAAHSYYSRDDVLPSTDSSKRDFFFKVEVPSKHPSVCPSFERLLNFCS